MMLHAMFNTSFVNAQVKENVNLIASFLDRIGSVTDTGDTVGIAISLVQAEQTIGSYPFEDVPYLKASEFVIDEVAAAHKPQF